MAGGVVTESDATGGVGTLTHSIQKSIWCKRVISNWYEQRKGGSLSLKFNFPWICCLKMQRCPGFRWSEFIQN